MNAKQLQDVSNKKERNMGQRVWWLGTSLAIITALAIALAIYNAPASKATDPAVRAQSVPGAEAQGVASYLRAHDDPSFHASQRSNSDRLHDDPSFHAAQRSNLDRLHDDPSFHAPQASDTLPVDRSFHTPQTSNYVPVGQSSHTQAAPDPNYQSVMDYLRAHGYDSAAPSAEDNLRVPNSVRATYRR